MMRRLASALLAGSAFVALSAFAAPSTAQVRLSGDLVGGGDYTVKVMSWREAPFRTVVRQQYDFSCGSAAAATLLRYHYGVQVSEQDLFKAMWAEGDQANIRKVGFSLLDMKRALEARGYKADGFRLTLDQLEHYKTPAIALIVLGKYRHFVVIKGVRAGQVLIGDPALGLHIFPRKDFEKIWNGVAFAIHGRTDGHAEAQPAFDLASEWSPWARAPLDSRLTDESLATFTREMPTLYQVSRIFNLPHT